MADVILQTKVDAKRPILRLEALAEKISAQGMSAFFHATAIPLLQERAADRFLGEGDDASGAWKPLAASTITRRQNAGQVPIRINDRTGKMKNWIVNADGRVFASKGLAVLEWPGSSKNTVMTKKVKTAQFGEQATKTPPRPVIAIDGGDLLTILTLMEEWTGLP